MGEQAISLSRGFSTAVLFISKVLHHKDPTLYIVQDVEGCGLRMEYGMCHFHTASFYELSFYSQLNTVIHVV